MGGYLPDGGPGPGVDEDGWLHTGDLARWAGPERIQVYGRLKETVIVNGFNVVPAEVEQIVGDHDSVATAMVVGIPDDRSGERLVACVVPREGHSVDPERVVAQCRERLPAFKVPSQVVVLDELPTTGTSKRSRRLLTEQVQGMPSMGPPGLQNGTEHSDQHPKG
jgi:fatty-acyl-CoA synthase